MEDNQGRYMYTVEQESVNRFLSVVLGIHHAFTCLGDFN